MKKENNYIGSSFDDFLKEEGIYDSCKEAIKEVEKKSNSERKANDSTQNRNSST